MPQTLTREDLSTARTILNDTSLSKDMAASAMYSYLSGKGYKYADLANGVALGNSLAGSAALAFMKTTAESENNALSDVQINEIRYDMADGYLDSLDAIADVNNDVVSRDITGAEAWRFHDVVFESKNLPIDAWTLNAVFKSMDNPADIETYWQMVLESAGDPTAELMLALQTFSFMHLAAAEGDGVLDATNWLGKIISIDGLGSMLKGITNFDSKEVQNLEDSFGYAQAARSPLVLDLDGDGIETVGTVDGVYFDHDSNGFSEKSGWVNGGDGLLVWDKNLNGIIDNGAELFGNGSISAAGDRHKNGFLALSELDSNIDGFFDISDGLYNTVKVWVDRDQDGFTDGGELLSLSEAGIASVNLSYLEPGILDANGDVPDSVVDSAGNQHRQVGTYTKSDGTKAAINDVWFAVNGSDTIDKSPTSVEFSMEALPNIQGFGNVHDLAKSMSLDTALRDLVKQFGESNDANARDAILLNIIYRWAGVGDIDPDSRAATQLYGNAIGDARKLAALEAFLGTNYVGIWCWGQRDPNPHGPAAAILLQAFDNFASAIYSRLMLQTHFTSYLDALTVSVNAEGSVWDVSSVVSKLYDLYSSDPARSVDHVNAFVRSLNELGGFGELLIANIRNAVTGDLSFDSILVNAGREKSIGTAANDTLNGTVADDFLYGDAGNDRVYGGNGDDNLVGGTGNDYLVGGDGNDRYLFSRGNGNDAIYNAHSDDAGTKLDVLIFGADIAPAEVIIKRVGYDLVLNIAGADDSVTVLSYFDEITVANHSYAVDEIRFQDGSVWNVPAVKNMLLQSTDFADNIVGYEGSDIILGGLGDDSIAALGGNDTIYGGEGNDALDGGVGNDVLNGGSGANDLNGGDGNDVLISTEKQSWSREDRLTGGAGSDIYVVTPSVGDVIIYNADPSAENIDTLRFSSIATPSNTRFTRMSDALFISVNGYNFSVGIMGFFSQLSSTIDLIEFANGEVWTHSEIEARLTVATGGDDLLFAYDKDSVLAGADGNDTIDGGSGNDIYFGDDGNDLLNGGDGNDRLVGGRGEDQLVSGSGRNILDGGEGDDRYESWRADFDTYIMRENSGHDVVWSLPKEFEVYLENVRVEDVSVEFHGSEIKLSIQNGGSLSIVGITTFSTGANIGLNLRDSYSNKISYSPAQLNAMYLGGSINDDRIYGFSSGVTVQGNAGDDMLFGQNGNDILVGGKDQDILEGGGGNDVYIFSKGDGADLIHNRDVATAKDKIRFLDVSSDEIIVSKTDNFNLEFRVRGTRDKITVEDYYVSPDVINGISYDSNLEEVEFSDGVIWGGSDFETAQSIIQNTAPVVVGTLPVLRAIIGEYFSFQVPENFAYDSDQGDAVFYDIESQFSQDAFPSWLNFDVNTRTLYGRPSAMDAGAPSLILKVSDSYGWGENFAVDLTVGQRNLAPIVAGPPSDQIFTEGSAFAYYLYSETAGGSVFNDPDNDQLTYTAMQSSGAALPSWLKFDARTGGFKGTVPVGYLSPLNIIITASDPFGASASTNLNINIKPQGKTFTGTSRADNMVGGAGDDVMNGNAGNDTILGNSGHDTINGGTGIDNMSGGAGDDVYYVDSLSDVTIERVDEGLDSILSSVSWSLSANTEYLQLLGTTAINGTGNSLSNTIYGNSGVNILTGGAGNDNLNGAAGADRMIGGTGDDFYSIDNSGDTVVENSNEGHDTVFSSISYTLASGVEDLELSDGVAVNGTGNSLDNSIIGNSSANILSGGAGNDRLDGGGGADMLQGGTGNDTYMLVRNAGRETVIDSDATLNTIDVAVFPYSVTSHQLWFSRPTGTKDLEVSIIGTSDALVVKDWYVAQANHIEKFVASDGKVLIDSQVQNLVDAMSAFSPPAMGHMVNMSGSTAAILEATLVANWK